jgi:threonine aldolase
MCFRGVRMTPIDLRSDTLTKPTPGMLEAMANADVGDDVWGEDPTVAALEARAAAYFGKDAGLFCPSGTMTNQIAIRVHVTAGDDVICSSEAHVYQYEGGAIAATSGASVRLLPGDRGRFTAADVGAAIQPDDPHYPRTRLVAVEDTSNRGGGACWRTDELDRIREVCTRRGLALHLDGARVWNRLVAKGDDPLAYARRFDSISVCLSKGLGAPVGSVLLGTKDFVHAARRVRKRLGGGMRQAGYLAACGLYALEHHVARLAEDHRRARDLEAALARTRGIARVLPVETNIVIAEASEPAHVDALLAHVKGHGVLAAGMGPGRVRFVTHLGIDDAMVARVVEALAAF